MHRIATIVTVVLLTASAHAQDRLVSLGYVGTIESQTYAPGLIEMDVAGTRFGPSRGLTIFPRHRFDPSSLVSMAGGRYLAWLAQVNTRWDLSDCREYVAVFDRRLGTGRIVPDIVLPCVGLAKLIGDRRRPRVFLHTWATASGIPGGILSIDAQLTVQPVVISNRLGTAFAYAPDADQLFTTYLGTSEDRRLSVAVFSGSTGDLLRTFPARDALNVSFAQMQVTADGRQAFLWTAWGHLLPFEREIRAFDVAKGTEVAASTPVHIGGNRNQFVLDEERQIILTPHVNMNSPIEFHLLAFDVTTLLFIGEANPGGYGPSGRFQPLRGRGPAAAYLIASASATDGCRAWADAFDGIGTLRARDDLRPFSNSLCDRAAVILSSPDRPSALTASVIGRRVTLNWANAGDTSEFEIDVGVAPGRHDLTARVGLATEFVVDDVPAGVYYVRVRAINEIGTSPASNEVEVIVP